MSTSPGEARPNGVAIVAGASRGIGAATAHRLAAEGYAVVVNCAHDHGPADVTVDSILAGRGAAVTIRADVADELDVERLFAETVEAFGHVDVVVQAVVGHLFVGPVSNVTLDQFNGMCQTNTLATFLLNREAARHLRDGGAIVNLTSSLVGRPVPPYGAHTASQAGTDVFTRVLAVELAERGITVNAIALDVDGPCQPELVADRVAFLVGAEGHRTTGRVLSVHDPAWAMTGLLNGDGSGH
jgi:3-oxoacyl-[acyl-carrier protein] reductase